MRIEEDHERSEAEVAEAQKASLAASLRRERAGYVTRGLDRRAAQVDEQLKELGADKGPAPEPEERGASAPMETAVESKPRTTASGRSNRKS
ncbi:hypothetical protein [Streptomyces sp. NBC_01022]|uniref:hypothetical protein n=1 Tax=Streptomyces sp. NBC_01022 TaxID=2903723 RepID=UPI002DDAEF13|nr:hypothetical protein [Streptomyces sp. NBC_01022]WRZ84848.1 hypothetical protein OG316_33600 [Streptomyces sp. NBC_01022]